MNVHTMAVAGLNERRKYIIFYNNTPVMICGKTEVPLITTVIYNGKICEEVPLEKGKQGRILKIINTIKSKENK